MRTRSSFLAGALVAGSLLVPTAALAQDGTGTVTVLHGVPGLTVDVYVNGDLTGLRSRHRDRSARASGR